MDQTVFSVPMQPDELTKLGAIELTLTPDRYHRGHTYSSWEEIISHSRVHSGDADFSAHLGEIMRGEDPHWEIFRVEVYAGALLLWYANSTTSATAAAIFQYSEDFQLTISVPHPTGSRSTHRIAQSKGTTHIVTEPEGRYDHLHHVSVTNLCPAMA